MALYYVHARRIDDRPDDQGDYSSGHDLPTFYVDAASPDHALRLAHDVAGNQVANMTRTLVTTYQVDDETQTLHESTRYAPGWNAERVDAGTVEVQYQYSQDGWIIDGSPTAEQDADAVTVFDAHAGVVAALTRTPRGRWRIETSDYAHLKRSHHDARFSTPEDAAHFVAKILSVRLVPVTTWD